MLSIFHGDVKLGYYRTNIAISSSKALKSNLKSIKNREFFSINNNNDYYINSTNYTTHTKIKSNCFKYVVCHRIICHNK